MLTLLIFCRLYNLEKSKKGWINPVGEVPKMRSFNLDIPRFMIPLLFATKKLIRWRAHSDEIASSWTWLKRNKTPSNRHRAEHRCSNHWKLECKRHWRPWMFTIKLKTTTTKNNKTINGYNKLELDSIRFGPNPNNFGGIRNALVSLFQWPFPI